MKSRWYFPFDGMEEASFTRVPEGWAFSTRTRVLFGPRQTYLLNDDQKAAIAVELRLARRLLFVAIVILAAIMAPITFPSFDAQSVTALATVTLVGAIIGWGITGYFLMKIRPIVAGLPTITLKASRRDAFGTRLAAFTRGRILFFMLASLALFLMIAVPPLLEPTVGWDFWSVCAALLFGLGTIFWFAMYIAKGRQAAP